METVPLAGDDLLLFRLSVRDTAREIAKFLSNSSTAGNVEPRLIAAIDNGSLATSLIRRDFETNAVDPEATLIDIRKAWPWFEDRGIESFFEDFLSFELTVHGYLEHSLSALRVLYKSQGEKAATDFLLRSDRLLTEDEPLPSDVHELQSELSATLLRIEELERYQEPRSTKSSVPDLPPTELSKRSYLRIIGAFCKLNGIDWRARGAAAQIQRLVDDAGTTVTDDTVRKILGRITDAF